MSKLEELFKKADGDEALKNALIAAQEEYQAAKAKAREAKQEKIIELAKKAGVTLEAADFKPKTEPLADEGLEKATGGGEWDYWRDHYAPFCICSKSDGWRTGT